MDVKSAFLNRYLKEEAFVKQPSGFECHEHPEYVFKLDKTLYGSKQAPRTCYVLLCPIAMDQATTGRFWDIVEKGLICMKFCKTEDHVADIFTKALSKEHFEKNRLELGLIKLNWEPGKHAWKLQSKQAANGIAIW
uniref:Uncharacterized protein LOC104211643 n=1 Tax=Nicotiana sylvestris TaxID=4096 RepID=A0A1U7V247_NICSY|nr:PREDICTED: uncharacterized protein LOC104211643 [Nicotiana sylvestris]